jgi:hypothetical protein
MAAFLSLALLVAIKPAATHLPHLTQHRDGPLSEMLGQKGILQLDSLAKKIAAFF